LTVIDSTVSGTRVDIKGEVLTAFSFLQISQNINQHIL